MEELNEVFSQFSEIFSGSTPVMPEMAEMECLAAEFVKDGVSFVERQKLGIKKSAL